MKLKILSVLFVVLAFLLVGCTDVTQIVNPSDVVVGPQPTEPTPPTTPGPGIAGTVTLEPPSIELDVGQTVFVTVTVRDSGGQDVPSENISVNILNTSVLRLTEIDGRIIALEGLTAGVTSVIVTASGLQTSLVATVQG